MRKTKVLNPDAVQWCIANDFYIYPVTKDNLNYNIVVEKKQESNHTGKV